MLQNIIQKYKHFIAIACVLLGFLMVHNQVFCDLSFFQKWYLNVENYFLTLTWEKAISDPVELSKSIGWVSISAIGSLYAFEGIWNARLLGSKFLYNYTPLGHLDDGSGIIKSWFGFRNTAGPLKNVIDTVPYEEILPLFMARKYVFPYVFRKSNSDRINSSGNQPNPVINNTNINNIQRVEMNSIGVQADLSPTVITERVERPVYVAHTEYRDRENLVEFTREVRELKTVVQESNLIQRRVNFGREGIAQELSALHQYNDPNFLRSKNISDKFFLRSICFQYTPRTEKIIFEFIFGSLRSEKIKETKHRINFLEWKANFPILSDIFNAYSELDLINHSQVEGALARPSFVYLNLNYKNEQTGFFSVSVVDAYNCSFSAMTIDPVNAIDVGVDIMLRQNESSQGRIDELVTRLENKIFNENRLINIETRDQGTQTAYFDLNETIYDRINTFLEVRDETSFIVASHEGRNLPFNNMQIQSYSKPQEITNTQATPIKTQTESSINENVGTIGMTAANSNLFQNMTAFFTTVLVGAIAHDFQTIELVARSLLGFIHIPEYNQAFITATEMSVVDLQMTYNLNLDEARRAYDALDFAKEMRNTGSLPSDLSSTLSDTNNYTDNVPKSGLGWRDYLLIGTSIVVIGSAILYITQSMKTGSYDGNEIQTLSPHVEAWKNAYFDKIRKL